MINYNQNLFVILIICLMRISSIKCQYETFSSTSSMRPIWKFSSFFQSNVQYQCYQKCIPVVQSQPQMMVDLCNKICPFNPSMPDCIKCPKILSQTVPIMSSQEIVKRLDMVEPEIIVIEPQSHAIFFRPEVMVVGQERKQCCYMDQCETVPLNSKCESRCYEPCDAVCTGRCRLNPQCPNQCEVVKQKLYKVQYKMWLATRLNEIKRKYRALAQECLLKTRLAFVQEVQQVQNEKPTFLGDQAHVPQPMLQPQMIPTQQQQQLFPGQIVLQLQDEDDVPEIQSQALSKNNDNKVENHDYHHDKVNSMQRPEQLNDLYNNDYYSDSNNYDDGYTDYQRK